MVFAIIIGALVFVSLMFLYVLAAAFVIWMSVDAAKQDKFWWLVLVIGLPLIGAIVYYFVEKKGDYMKTTPVHTEKKEAKEEAKQETETKE